MEVKYNATLLPLANGSADIPALTAQLRAAHATRADLLVLIMREPEFRHALEVLQAARPPETDGHVYKGMWWQGVPWGGGIAWGWLRDASTALERRRWAHRSLSRDTPTQCSTA